MAVKNDSIQLGSMAHMLALETKRRQPTPTAKEECFETLKSIGRVALGALICSIAIALFPISIPLIGWVVHKQNVAEKVRSAAQRALPIDTAPVPANEGFTQTVDSLDTSNKEVDEPISINFSSIPE